MNNKEFINSISEGARITGFMSLIKCRMKLLQAVPLDGNFGPITRQHVVEYQEGKSIVADGIVGKNTWTAMIIK